MANPNSSSTSPTPATPTFDISTHVGPEQTAEVAKAVEASGQASGLFVPEGAHDPAVSLAMAAAATSRIDVGSGISLAFARTPMALAYTAYDLQRLSAGRFVLGLGSQVKPHITRRFAMPWSQPAARMAEYIAALREIWWVWGQGGRLDFCGDFYQHTLMPPLFRPEPLPTPPRIWLAGVGPRMVAVAAQAADGLLTHPLLSRAYLDEVITPAIRAHRPEDAHPTKPFTLAAMVMVATGHTEREIQAAIAATRAQIGFYASTPAYERVLAHHGWSQLHTEAHRLTREGKWEQLGDLVDDEVLATFAVTGTLAQVGQQLPDHLGPGVDRIMLSLPYSATVELPLAIVHSAITHN